MTENRITFDVKYHSEKEYLVNSYDVDEDGNKDLVSTGYKHTMNTGGKIGIGNPTREEAIKKVTQLINRAFDEQEKGRKEEDEAYKKELSELDE